MSAVGQKLLIEPIYIGYYWWYKAPFGNSSEGRYEKESRKEVARIPGAGG